MSNNDVRLCDLFKQVENKMMEMGFNQDGIKRYRKAWAALEHFSPTEYFDEKICADFLREYCKIELENPDIKFTKSQMYLLRSVRVLSEYNRFKTFFRRTHATPSIVWPEHFKAPMEAFFQHVNGCDYSDSWLKRLKREIRSFIQYIDRLSVSNIGEIKSEHVTGYLSTQDGYSQGEVAAKLTCLRTFFEYLYFNEYHKMRLSLLTPKCRVFPRKNVPTVWAKEDIEKILNSIDKGNPSGKRDYAIILLAAKLGLRVSDIRNLQLNELNWEKSTIDIVQTKTKEPLSLPLLPDVGWAIIDYLQNGRPKTDSKNVFIRHLAPFEAFCDSGNLQHIITKHISKAGVKPPGERSAMHSLRNSLATELLQQNITLPVISGILGHTSMETSRHYLRVDIDGLRKCALDVEVLNHA